ncbi:MAG: hypothetical protein Q9208_008666 [Pyrenodesmia sp. 3 TL-2023]
MQTDIHRDNSDWDRGLTGIYQLGQFKGLAMVEADNAKKREEARKPIEPAVAEVSEDSEVLEEDSKVSEKELEALEDELDANASKGKSDAGYESDWINRFRKKRSRPEADAKTKL